jgi:hypothetical protein
MSYVLCLMSYSGVVSHLGEEGATSYMEVVECSRRREGGKNTNRENGKEVKREWAERRKEKGWREGGWEGGKEGGREKRRKYEGRMEEGG